MKQFEADGLQVWQYDNGSVGFSIGYEAAELTPKEAAKLISYLAKCLTKKGSK